MRSRESGVGDLGRCLRALALVVCGALVGSPAAVARDRAPAFRAALEHAGFIVQSGDTQVSDAFELVEANVLASASGNNAGQLYKRLDVPGPPGPGGTPGTAANGIFNLRPGEAIVWAGPTPPRGDYFSFTPFLWVRSYQSILAKVTGSSRRSAIRSTALGSTPRATTAGSRAPPSSSSPRTAGPIGVSPAPRAPAATPRPR